jgi:ABC-type cobalamin/Fe3+-siderophores transport system ATPase subunit
MFELEHVRVGYGEGRVLQDLSLRLGDGEFCAVLGPNGAVNRRC